MILLFSTRICQQAKEPTHFYLCVLSTFLYLHECMHTYTIILSHRVEENESLFFSHEQGQIRQEQKHSHTHTHKLFTFSFSPDPGAAILVTPVTWTWEA